MQLFPDDIFNCAFKFFIIEAALIVADWNNPLENLIDVKHFFRKVYILVDALVDRLSKLNLSGIDELCTIRNRPSMIAINPPRTSTADKVKVLTRQRRLTRSRARRPISSMTSRKIKSDDNPRTPPPSRDKILGQWFITATLATRLERIRASGLPGAFIASHISQR